MKSNPFAVAIDPREYYHTDNTKRIIAQIIHCLKNRNGFALLIGDVGVGKTSLLMQILPILQKEGITTSFILNSLLKKKEILAAICRDFGLQIPHNENVFNLLDLLHTFFLKENSRGRNCVIIVDEAHNLDVNVLETLRMLTNLETEGKKLVQIFLTGQSELWVRLKQPKLRQLRSRINVFEQLLPLDKIELQGYVLFKLASTGSQIRPEKRALRLLWIATQGNIRMVNLIMERALYALILRKKQNIDYQITKEALEDLYQCQGELKKRVLIHNLKKYIVAFAVILLIFTGVLLA
ncbi:MAG: AAA family ATPase, partial [Desulfovibrionales bacterium]